MLRRSLASVRQAIQAVCLIASAIYIARSLVSAANQRAGMRALVAVVGKLYSKLAF